MLRDWPLRIAGMIATIGIVLGLALLCSRRNDPQVDVVRAATGQLLETKRARVDATVALDRARATASAAEGDAEAAVSRAVAARARARIVGADGVVVPSARDVPPVPMRVTAPVVERMRLDSTALDALGTLVRWKDTVIVRQDRRFIADSLELAAASNAFTALQRVKEPRCGRKCGIVLGVGGILAATITIDKLRQTFR